MENIVIKIDVFNLCIITKPKTKIAINPLFNPKKQLYFAVKRGIMAIICCFGGELTLDNANGVRGNAFAAARKAEFFFRCGFYIDVFYFRAKSFGYVFSHFFNVRGKLRSLRYYRSVDIGNGVAVGGKYLAAFCKYNEAGNSLYALVVIGEVEAYVALCASAENCVGDSVQKHICVAVTEQAFFVFYLNTAEDEVAPLHKAVNVVAVTYSEVHSAFASSEFIMWRTRSKSSGKVIFILLSPHSTSFTLKPDASARDASSVA